MGRSNNPEAAGRRAMVRLQASWFLVAYACSGFAALVYEVAWTRLLTLYMGHTTAATSTVFAAFMGGLGLGSGLFGLLAARLSPRRALQTYAALEAIVALAALTTPRILVGIQPILSWAYDDGAPGPIFPIVRVACCLTVLFVPAAALGGTFPLAIRWFVHTPGHPGHRGGQLYAINTLGAGVGATAAGFFLIPRIGLTGATAIGVTATGASVLLSLILANKDQIQDLSLTPDAVKLHMRQSSGRPQGRTAEWRENFWLAGVTLAITGFATFMYEITWTRVFALLVGPSTYAVSATLASFVIGLAVGSAAGSQTAGRTTRPFLPLSLALTMAAAAASLAAYAAGGPLLHYIAEHAVIQQGASQDMIWRYSLVIGAMILPTAVALGFAFPFTMELAGSRRHSESLRLGAAYGINTLAAVLAALVTGFAAIPMMGLQPTLRMATALLLGGALIVMVRGYSSMRVRIAALAGILTIAGVVFSTPTWDRELLASGVYMYARRVPAHLDVETALKTGALLYYREGAASTVSVKRIAGELSLAIDGKVDASTSGDMLTQKLLAHLPLMLHENPQTVLIIGLGSGVTLTSATVHPVESVEVAELSPEVVAASKYFSAVNHEALTDPRVHLIAGDGRSHLALTSRRYDVIISEPSNPWMNGVASLFTREFFESARRHLATRGIICQWIHTYDISDADLRSVTATFASVFPTGTLWLVGDGDLLLIGSIDLDEPKLDNLLQAWHRTGVAADLAEVSVADPFSLLSLYVGGPKALATYASEAPLQSDDRMTLEFSGPDALYKQVAPVENVANLRKLTDEWPLPPVLTQHIASAGSDQWRHRADMMFSANAYDAAYEDYVRAVDLDPTDAEALNGVVRAAVAQHQETDATRLFQRLIADNPEVTAIQVALSRLTAARGAVDEAISYAAAACRIDPLDPDALEQLASLYSDSQDLQPLQAAVGELQQNFPDRWGTWYYASAAQFMAGHLANALPLAERAIELDPRRGQAYNLAGIIHANLGEQAAARKAFETAITLDPRDSETYANLGLLELQSGDRQRAAGHFREAVLLDPNSTMARTGLAESQSR